MRKFTTLVAALLMAVATFAQAPQGFSYQAVVRDAQNAIVANQTVEVTVTILQGASADAAKAVFTEKHSAKTNANGLFTITVGSVDNAEFAKIDWGKGNSFLKTESAYGESTTQLMSVPYALYAEKAASIDAAQLAQTLNSNDVKAILNLGATTIVNNALAEANYATTSSVKSTVNNALANYATTENVNTTVNNALASYATTEKLKDTLSLYAKIEDLPEGVNLTGYAKTADVDATYAKKTDLNAKANTADLATVATSGSYNDLTNKPTIPTVPTATSQLTADKIGDMPMATVNVVITNVDNVATVSFLGKELTSGTTTFKIPAYSPVFLSVVLSQYQRPHEDPTHYRDYYYYYTVKINGVDFDPVLGYYYDVRPTMLDGYMDNNGKFDARGIIEYDKSWGRNGLKYPDNVTDDAGFQTYMAWMYYPSTEFISEKKPIYKSGSGKVPTNPYDPYLTQTDAERNMVNQVVGPFPNATNTIEIVIKRDGGAQIIN